MDFRVRNSIPQIKPPVAFGALMRTEVERSKQMSLYDPPSLDSPDFSAAAIRTCAARESLRRHFRTPLRRHRCSVFLTQSQLPDPLLAPCVSSASSHPIPLRRFGTDVIAAPAC